MFSSSTPSGSPLSGGWLSASPSRMAPASPFTSDLSRPTAMSPSGSLTAQLPPAPPAKRPTIWDKEHISATLADIGAGFFAGQNFGDGLGAAAQTIAGRTRQLSDEQRPDISYGGPGDQFEISTNRRTGERSVREVPEFRAAAERTLAAKNAPDPKDRADLRARALYAISTQVPPEQRAAAYRRLIANPEQFGIDATGMPAEWDGTYGTLGGMMGMSVPQALTQERANVLAKSLIDHRQVQDVQGDKRGQQADARLELARTTAAQRANLRSAPPRTKRPRSGSLAIGTAMGGFTYQGGDPHDRNNWKKQ